MLNAIFQEIDQDYFSSKFTFHFPLSDQSYAINSFPTLDQVANSLLYLAGTNQENYKPSV